MQKLCCCYTPAAGYRFRRRGVFLYHRKVLCIFRGYKKALRADSHCKNKKIYIRNDIFFMSHGEKQRGGGGKSPQKILAQQKKLSKKGDKRDI